MEWIQSKKADLIKIKSKKEKISLFFLKNVKKKFINLFGPFIYGRRVHADKSEKHPKTKNYVYSKEQKKKKRRKIWIFWISAQFKEVVFKSSLNKLCAFRKERARCSQFFEFALKKLRINGFLFFYWNKEKLIFADIWLWKVRKRHRYEYRGAYHTVLAHLRIWFTQKNYIHINELFFIMNFLFFSNEYKIC